jgi:hypothetical protein
VEVHALLLEGSAQSCEARKGLRYEKNTVLLCYRCTLTNLGGLAARFVKFEGVV